MSTMKLYAPDYCVPGYASPSLGSWGATLNNLLDPDIGNPAISTDATTTSTQFALDLGTISTLRGAAPGADALFIPKSNLTQSATIRVKAGDAPFTSGGSGGGSIAYDSTAIAALTQILYPAGYTNAWGRNNVNTPDPIMDASYNRGVYVPFGASKIARYWWVGITDTGNPAGYVSIGRVFLGPVWQPSRNFNWGVTESLEGTRAASESANNSEFIDSTRRLRRVVTCECVGLSIDEAHAIFLPLSTYLAYDKQALFAFDPSDTYHTPRRTYLVVQQKPISISYQDLGQNNVSMMFQEVT